MKTTVKANRYFQITIASVSLIFLILGFFYSNISAKNPLIFLLIPISSGVLTQFPIRLLKNDFFLTHIITILGSLIVDPALTAFGIMLGVIIGYLFRWLVLEKKSWKNIQNPDSWGRIGFTVGLNIIPLAAAFFFVDNAPFLGELTSIRYWQELLFVNIIFMSLQGTIFYINFLIGERDVIYPNRRSDILTLLKIDIFSIFFIFLIMAYFSETELEAIIFFIGIPIIIAYLLYKSDTARIEIEHKDQKLSKLYQISHTIQSTQKLDKLLPEIQEKVMLLLDVNNFYVCLYDDKTTEIRYPFAMKNGQKQNWLCRPISNRLTDRVIQSGHSILYSPQTIQKGAIDELPTSDETPVSWLGVPLNSSERTIGCMAVFSLQPGKYFSTADQDVMTILSGQVSLAIQNALLFQQTEHRMDKLDTKNQLSTSMTANLDLTQVLSHVGNAVTQVAGNEKSVISLVDPGGETASLDHVHERLSAILNTIDDGILMLDNEGNVQIANQAIRELTGFAVEDFLYRKFFDLPDYLLEAIGLNHVEITSIFQEANINLTLVTNKTIVESKTMHRKRIIERTIKPLWGNRSKPYGIIILIRDITEASEIEKTRDAITETIVHDVRSPMSAIVGALDLLKDVISDTENPIVTQALSVAERSAIRVISLTEEILDIARLQSGGMVIEKQDIDLQKLVEDLMIDFTAMANDKGVLIRNNVSSETAHVRADLDKLIRILTNLVDNAIKFSHQDGHVIISAESEDQQYLTVRVTDYGAGIPSEYREKIFERYVQVPGQYYRRGGTGLGLAFCRLAVEAHDGQIWVEHNPDGGSIFAFTIPTT